MTNPVDNGPCETPLLELARSVPKDFRGEWESQWFDDGTPSGHSMAPVGRYLHEMADEIERLRADRDRQKRSREHWIKQFKKLEADNERLRDTLRYMKARTDEAEQALSAQEQNDG